MKFKPRQDRSTPRFHLPHIFGAHRTKEILSMNPTIEPQRPDASDVSVFVFDYDANNIEERHLPKVSDCFRYKTNGRITWINIDGLRKGDVESVCAHYDVHPLIVEDILSINQRPKMEEMDNGLFCLLNMLFYDPVKQAVEQEQISIVVGKDYVLSFQEDGRKDVFDPLRERLKLASGKIRQRGTDYLCYSLLDMIVDHYFTVMEKLGEQIEEVEEGITHGTNTQSLPRITVLRKELIILKRNFSPVRELVNGFLRSDSEIIDPATTKYFKDVYDHIVQSIDLVENYRDIIVSMQDLHINNVNLKMNEVMKVMAIVTCLLAPATVIGGIFGMNFDSIPYLHNQYGFWVAVGIMLLIPVWMIVLFRKRGWF